MLPSFPYFFFTFLNANISNNRDFFGEPALTTSAMHNATLAKWRFIRFLQVVAGLEFYRALPNTGRIFCSVSEIGVIRVRANTQKAGRQSPNS